VNGNWARVFDFGNINGSSGQNFLFYTPHNASAGQTLGFSTTAATVNFNSAGTFDNRAVQVVCLVDPANNYCAIYTNGVLQSSLNSPLPAFSGVSTAWSFLGRSLFSTDPYLNATIDEFRIYDGRLTPEEIAADYKFGPNALALPVALTPSNSAAGLTLSWPSWAIGFTPETISALAANASWSSVTSSPILANDRWQFTLPKTNSTQFFRLRR
jgi:hypothetical protein